MFDFTPIEYVSGSFLVVISLTSVLCSSVILYIIHKIDKWNGYLILIYSMTACQIINDTSYPLLIFYENEVAYRFVCFFLSFGGLSVTLWTNILSGVLLYIVLAHTSLQIWDHYWKFFAICMFPSLCFAAFDASYALTPSLKAFAMSYNIFRLISIVFNFMVYAIITRKLHLLGNTAQSKAVGPLRELASRFKYYPICQVITRLPAVMYQFVYGFGPATFNKRVGTAHGVALVFHGLFTPAAGIAFFIVFLYMQPQGSAEFYKLRQKCYKNCCCCCCCCESSSSDLPLMAAINPNFDHEEMETSSIKHLHSRESSSATVESVPIFSPTSLRLSGTPVGNLIRVNMNPTSSETGSYHLLYRPVRTQEVSETTTDIDRDQRLSDCPSDGGGQEYNRQAAEWQMYREMDEDELNASIVTSNSSMN